MTCTKCNDEKWLHIQHPVKPLGVVMCSVPCDLCNADGMIAMPSLDVSYSISMNSQTVDDRSNLTNGTLKCMLPKINEIETLC